MMRLTGFGSLLVLFAFTPRAVAVRGAEDAKESTYVEGADTKLKKMARLALLVVMASKQPGTSVSAFSPTLPANALGRSSYTKTSNARPRVLPPLEATKIFGVTFEKPKQSFYKEWAGLLGDVKPPVFAADEDDDLADPLKSAPSSWNPNHIPQSIQDQYEKEIESALDKNLAGGAVLFAIQVERELKNGWDRHNAAIAKETGRVLEPAVEENARLFELWKAENRKFVEKQLKEAWNLTPADIKSSVAENKRLGREWVDNVNEKPVVQKLFGKIKESKRAEVKATAMAGALDKEIDEQLEELRTELGAEEVETTEFHQGMQDLITQFEYN